jgi:hypothetical protein
LGGCTTLLAGKQRRHTLSLQALLAYAELFSRIYTLFFGSL